MKNSKFNLFGTDWSVQYMKELIEVDGRVCSGVTSGDNTIKVSTVDFDNIPRATNEIRLTFLHELVHAILGTGQYLSENDDEPLVEWIARCLMALQDQKII